MEDFGIVSAPRRISRTAFVGGVVASALAADAAEAASGIADFERGEFRGDDGVVRAYYRGGDGPPVMVLHEVFGLTPDDVDFGRRLAKRGFTVYMPVLFGVPNHPATALYSFAQLVHVCVSREFDVFAKRRSSPVAHALRALGREMFARHGGRGIGVIGLCLTGNFALAMMADAHVVAPVVSEPALPFGVTAAAHAALHLDEKDLACAKKRAAEGAKYLGFRFDGDSISPAPRFAQLQDELGGAFYGCTLKPVQHGAHAVFTKDFTANAASTHPAFERLVDFLTEQLGAAPPA